jgi:hypothetical protein
MARPLLGSLLLGFALLVTLAGCGKNWSDIPATGLDEPQVDLPRIPIAQVIAASEGRLNTYAVFEGDQPDGRISHTTIPWNKEVAKEDGGKPEPRTWRSYETKGSYVEFQLLPQTGYALTRIHNPRNEATIIFDEPLVVIPPVIALDDPHTHHAAFEGWAKGWSQRRGTITVTTRYLGLQDATTPLGHFERCARVDALVRIRLPYGFSLTMNQRQWLHPQYGDIVREIDGRLSWSMIGVKRLHRRLELIETAPLDEAVRLEMVERGAGKPQ